MKSRKIILVILVIVLLGAGCSSDKTEHEIENISLKEEITNLEGKLARKNIENAEFKEQIQVYEKNVIPILENELKENEETYEETLEKLQKENIGHDFQRLQFKKDIDTILSYLNNSGTLPVYEGEMHSYTHEHIELINNWFVEFSDNRAKDIPTELMEWLYPVVFPIMITKTEVGFKSQYENAYYYNVVHYMTYGRDGDYYESKTIRAIGGVEDGFREIYIIEIYQENGKWKVGYTGFGG